MSWKSMNDAELRRQYSDLEARSDDLNDSMSEVEKLLREVEVEWARRHGCECALVGIVCNGHGVDDDEDFMRREGT